MLKAFVAMLHISQEKKSTGKKPAKNRNKIYLIALVCVLTKLEVQTIHSNSYIYFVDIII